MRHGNILSVICVVLPVLCFSACSVKEDRSNCPCWLEVSYVGRSDVEDNALICFGACNSGVRDSCEASMFNTPRILVCRRGSEILYGIARKPGMVFDDSKPVLIARGCQSDSIYSCRSILELNAEDARAQLSLHKQFMTLRFVCAQSSSVFAEFPYTLDLHGDTDGFDPVSGRPHAGVFRFGLSPDYGSPASVRIPRQGDGALYADLIKKDGSGLYSRLDLKAMLQAEGYDWNADELDDMEIVLNTDEIGFATLLRPWDSGESELDFN